MGAIQVVLSQYRRDVVMRLYNADYNKATGVQQE